MSILPEKTVYIKPIEREKWHGKEGAETFSAPVKLRALYNAKTGKYETGLTDKEKAELSKLLPSIDFEDTFVPDKPSYAWDEFFILTLYNRTNIFNLSNPKDYVLYKIAKASPLIANSLKAYKKGEYPEAIFYIEEDDEDDVKYKADEISIKRTAYSLFGKLSKKTKLMITFLILGEDLFRKSDEYIDVKTDEALNKDLSKFIELAKESSDRLVALYYLKRGKYYSLIVENIDGFFYKNIKIGSTTDEAIDFLIKDGSIMKELTKEFDKIQKK